MRVSLRLIALGLLTAVGAMASTAPATAVDVPDHLIPCLFAQSAPALDPAAPLDPAFEVVATLTQCASL